MFLLFKVSSKILRHISYFFAAILLKSTLTETGSDFLLPGL